MFDTPCIIGFDASGLPRFSDRLIECLSTLPLKFVDYFIESEASQSHVMYGLIYVAIKGPFMLPLLYICMI